MADTKDLLLAKYQEERESVRQHENQRATVTNVIVAVAAATIAFLGSTDGNSFNIAASLLLVALGLFGAVYRESIMKDHTFILCGQSSTTLN